MKAILRIRFLLLLGTFLLGVAPAWAQDFPNRPLRIIVANTPGTPLDAVARIMAPEMSKFLGQPVVVENKPGAGQQIGYEFVAKQAPADGYMIALVSVATLAIMPVTSKGLPFDPLKDLPPFIGLVEGRVVFAASANQPFRTLDELSQYAKANAGKLNYGASSPSVMLQTEAIVRRFGLNIVNVPYSANAPYVLALSTGEVQVGLRGESEAVALADKVRVLATTGDKRSAAFPNVPTPVQTIFSNIQVEPLDQAPAAAAQSLQDQAKLFADIAKQAGFQPQ